MNLDEWLWSCYVKLSRPGRLRACVELMYDSARGQPEWILFVRQLVWRSIIRRLEERFAFWIVGLVSHGKGVTACFNVMTEIPAFLVSAWELQLGIQLVLSVREFFIARPANTALS